MRNPPPNFLFRDFERMASLQAAPLPSPSPSSCALPASTIPNDTGDDGARLRPRTLSRSEVIQRREPVSWTPVNAPVEELNGQFRVLVNPAETERYFRLRAP